jgi:hypothetical protein
MANTPREPGDRVGIGVIWALGAALLASSCGGDSSDSAIVQGGGAVATCGVASAAGTAVTADVSNVSVTCSERLHTVGGAISGLTRAGLVLADGAHIVSVPANTTSFTLLAPVVQTNSYALAVAGQPAGLTCSVSNASGSMPASNATSVKVKCLNTADTVGGTAADLKVRRLMLFLALARSARSARP